MSDLKYEDDERIDHERAVQDLESSDPDVVARVLYSITRYETNTEWLEDQCLKKLISPELKVRWAAAVCLGVMALYRRPLDLKKVIPALEAAAQDPTISAHANDSLSMVREFLT
jgi:hypothetical protein